jgi:hypothetical protein
MSPAMTRAMSANKGGICRKDRAANDGGNGGQQGEHESDGGAREAGHCQLVGDVGITNEQTPTRRLRRASPGG